MVYDTIVFIEEDIHGNGIMVLVPDSGCDALAWAYSEDTNVTEELFHFLRNVKEKDLNGVTISLDNILHISKDDTLSQIISGIANRKMEVDTY